ncbi:MAG TPA: extensin family protein [Polyangiaceae bacterium]|nr:extensin family protein [Polyangiaceae bacterium]
MTRVVDSWLDIGTDLALSPASGQAPGVSLPWSAIAALGLALLGATSAHPSKPKPKPKATAVKHGKHGSAHAKPIPLRRAPGSRAEAYGQLTPEACLALLDERHIPYSREEPKRGVKIPVRLTGRLAGVLYRTDFPDGERSSVPWEIFDCRLVLSLDDFGEVLRAHSIAEVRMFSVWRPPAKSWPMTEWARRHQGALAIDVRELRKDNGEVLNVLEHFHGQLGVEQCVKAARPPNPDSPQARELHELVCAAAEAHVFNSILTPNYNPAHRNHFHLELTPDVDWFMLR